MKAELFKNFLIKMGVLPKAVPDVIIKIKLRGANIYLKDALRYLDTLKETHPHYFCK